MKKWLQRDKWKYFERDLNKAYSGMALLDIKAHA
jgi:hypothetical protein